MPDAPFVFEFDDVTAARPTGGPRFEGLSWAVREGEAWAVVGPVASGKSTLTELLAGRLVARRGEVRWPLLDRLRAAGRPVAFPSDLVYRVAFKEDSRLFSYAKHYYQQRFNFVEKDEDLLLGEFLRTGVRASDDAVQAAADRLGVGDRLGLSFLKLSNGQTRRARIARALLMNPELLVLDDPFVGVDAAGRDDLAGLLGDLVRGGHRLVLVTRPDAVPDWVTHVLELDGMAVKSAGSRSDALLSPPSGGGRGQEGGNLLRGEATGGGMKSPPPSLTLPLKGGGDQTAELVALRDVTVAYDGVRVLDRVTWMVRAGERWAVLGPNGSGKTTLLSLLCGDHPQAYANDVRLFGRRRGTGESIWEVKQRVGLVSPELHLYFTEPLTAAQTVATGFADVVVYHPATPDQRAAVRDLLGRTGLADLADRPFAQLSTGEQRQVLLCRALVKRPPLLILDEPFQGFDAATTARWRDRLDRELGPDQTVLFVTHHADEIPPSVTRTLRLDHGRAHADG